MPRTLRCRCRGFLSTGWRCGTRGSCRASWPRLVEGHPGCHRNASTAVELSMVYLREMTRNRIPDGAAVAAVAELMGDPSRAAILSALLGGVARPAGELARCAGVSPQTGSAHLAKLADGGIVTARTEGRHRYFTLAGPAVAHALGALALVAPPVAEPGGQGGFELRRLRRAR